jgi:hypothetical protein
MPAIAACANSWKRVGRARDLPEETIGCRDTTSRTIQAAGEMSEAMWWEGGRASTSKQISGMPTLTNRARESGQESDCHNHSVDAEC